MKLSRLVLVAALAFAALHVLPAHADPELVQQLTAGNPACGCVELFEDKAWPAVRLYARSRYHAEITAGLRFTSLDNMAEVVRPDYVVLKPGQPVLIGAIRQLDAQRACHYDYQFHWRWGPAGARAQAHPYRLPFQAGTSHRVLQGFNGAFSHHGKDAYAVDWDLEEGTPVLAAREGIVLAFNDTATGGGTEARFKDDANANWIVIRHPDGSIGAYYHLRSGGVRVRAGQVVKPGDWIGLSGNTGFSTGPHLHFSVLEARSSESVQSVPFVFRTSPDDEQGHYPVQGKTYTSF
jgi:murein DD-endopeptidase MepM/ murein hydrolase activator NlpD